ncbi:MAG: AhpC/TSA family protein [bacterium]
MFCREQVARFGAVLGEVESMGARMLAIGNGTASMARGFVQQFKVPFPVFTDPSRQVFALAGMKRRFGIGLHTLAVAGRALKEGFRQGRTQGDPWQQGGVLIILPPGEVAFEHVDQGAGDHLDPASVLAALEAALSEGPA